MGGGDDRRIEILRTILPDSPPGDRIADIKIAWEAAHGDSPGARTIAQDLKYGLKQGYWSQAGNGVARDPFTYFQRPPPTERTS